MFWQGEQGDFTWVYVVDGPSHADWAEYVKATQDAVDRVKKGRRTGFMSVFYRCKWATKSQRGVIRAILSRLNHADRKLSFVTLVTDSPFHMVAARAFQIVRGRIGVREKAFVQPRPSLRWFQKNKFEINLDELATDIRRRIPVEYLWRPFAEISDMPL